MPTVALDTNALMMPVELDVRVFDELDRLFGLGSIELVIPEAVLEELRSLSVGAGAEATAAAVGCDLATRCRTVRTDASYADDAIVELASNGDIDYVVTNDAPLRDRLLERGVRVIGLRGEHTLRVTEP